ncbi:MAG: UvrD-helicase domain-containing protein [Acidobacteria bacterium]|nr:UvrD-helicase domain-containing protein [Acidobacteriota bacterium]
MRLTDAQQSAVTRLGQDVCVVAGPGSGKTRVLVQRFAWLVREQSIDPGRILAITFTEKAATEIRKRLTREFEPDFATNPELRRGLERAPVSTVHGLCTRLLKEHALDIGLDPEFDILDERRAATMLRQSIDDALNTLLRTDPDRLRQLYDTWCTSAPVAVLEDTYGAIRAAGSNWAPFASPTLADITGQLRAALAAGPPNKTDLQRRLVSDVATWVAAPDAAKAIADLNRTSGPLRKTVEAAQADLITLRFAPQRETLDGLLRAIHQRYSTSKRLLSVLDFDDLEAFTMQMLESDARLRRLVQSRYDFILMDELQDTNPLQWRLVDLIRQPRRFFAVGDVNQAIDGFRHATPDAFQAYRARVEQEGGVVDQLRANFRSRPQVLAAAETVCTGAPGIETPGLLAERQFAEPALEPVVEVIIAQSEDARQRADWEARAVARRIQELVSRDGVAYRDIALLFRTGGRFPEFERVLTEAHVPYLLTGGKTFFDRQEVCDLVNYLRVLANPRNEVALFAVLRSPLVGVADQQLLELKSGRRPLAEVADLSFLARQRERMDDVPPDQLLWEAIDAANYAAALDPAARANVRKLLTLCRDFAQRSPGPLAHLVEHLTRLGQAGEEQNAPAPDSPDAVRIMTMHAAKGLEFPVVFCCALDGDARRDSGGLYFAPTLGLGATWRMDDGEEEKDGVAERIREQVSQREKEEASRLLYVALTRAEQKLILTYGQGKKRNPWVKLIEQLQIAVRPELITRRPEVLATTDDGLYQQPAPAGRGSVRTAPELLLDPPHPSRDQQERAGLEREHGSSGLEDSSVSASSLAVFTQCPRRYLLDRYLSWTASPPSPLEDETPTQTATGGPAIDLGLAVHALLAGEEVPEATPQAKRLANVFSQSPLAAQAMRAARTEREFDIVFELGGTIITGQIDLWFVDQEEVVIVDYKTDREAPTGPIEGQHSGYALQLQIYALALSRLLRRPVTRAVLHYLRPNQLVEVDLSAAALDRVAQRLQALQQAQATLIFPLIEDGHCRRCPHWRGACPSQFGVEQLSLF